VLLIAGSVRIDATHREELIAVSIEVLRELRKMAGCTHATISADLTHPAVLHVLQKWESPEAHRRAFGAPATAAIAAHAGKLGVREMSLLRYDVESVGAVIVFAGVIRFDPSRREAAIAMAIETMAVAREHKGCRAYVISLDIEDPGLLQVFQEWESEAALRAHVTDPAAIAARRQFDDLGVREMEIERFDVRSPGPIA
jgi:quinol monooxygenase YgiN